MRDRDLTHLLGDETPYSPPLEKSDLLDGASLPKPAKLTRVKVPSSKGLLNGQLLAEGALSLDQRKSHALLLTDGFTLIHISPDGMVSTKQGDEKKTHGILVSDESSLSLEKEKPFTFTIRYGRLPTSSLSGTLHEALLYDPPTPQRTRRQIRTPQTNMYSLLLRQFQR